LSDDLESLEAAVDRAARQERACEVLLCEPGEYRISQSISGWGERLGVPVTQFEDSRFLASHRFFSNWLKRQKQPRMEYFYREMRRLYGLLMEDDGKPAGGRWNYDRENRKGWRGQVAVPERDLPEPDNITREVIREVQQLFPENPGDLSRFYAAVTEAGARQHLEWFCENALGDFGKWQDAMAMESSWLFHSVISMYLNTGLLDALETCHRVQRAWRERRCDLAAAEGFIRQVLGWREFVRGIYWSQMPDYKERNYLKAERPLPGWFWTADTELQCLHQSLKQSLELGYGHHIQRLMVIGNFALLAGLSVKEICDWYLAVYIDAFEWVELPNTLGMALFADGGLMASKPYAATGKYIQRQSDYCKSCRFDPAKVTGPDACPYNALYWSFLERNRDALGANHRMAMMYANWDRKPAEDRIAILEWADHTLQDKLDLV
jgi:deoxyribodipyrimidine photolyase-related protein